MEKLQKEPLQLQVLLMLHCCHTNPADTCHGLLLPWATTPQPEVPCNLLPLQSALTNPPSCIHTTAYTYRASLHLQAVSLDSHSTEPLSHLEEGLKAICQETESSTILALVCTIGCHSGGCCSCLCYCIINSYCVQLLGGMHQAAAQETSEQHQTTHCLSAMVCALCLHSQQVLQVHM